MVQSLAGELLYLAGQPLFLMLVLVAVTMAIIWLLPKMTRAIPASLAAILVVTLASVAINQSMENPAGGNVLATVGDLVEINVSEDPQYHVATDRLA